MSSSPAAAASSTRARRRRDPNSAIRNGIRRGILRPQAVLNGKNMKATDGAVRTLGNLAAYLNERLTQEATLLRVLCNERTVKARTPLTAARIIITDKELADRATEYAVRVSVTETKSLGRH